MIFNRANKPAHCLGGGIFKEYLGDSCVLFFIFCLVYEE